MSKHLWVAYLACVAALTVVYLVAPDPATQGVAWVIIGWAPVAAIVAGVLLQRPTIRGPWWLTATGLTASGIAWVLTPASQDMTGTGLQAGIADVLHLSCTLMIGTAALWFARLQTPDNDRNSVIDGVIVAIAVATVLWSAVIDPEALGANASLSGRVVFVAAPILPAGISAICVRLLFTAGARLASARLLCGAWLLSAAGSIAWILLLQAGTFTPGGPTDVLWAAALGCAGASALHPSMTQLSRPTAARYRVESTARLLVLGVALFATPAAILTTAQDTQVHTVVPVAGAAFIALLVLLRLTRLIHEREAARRSLETYASRQEIVARVGQAALGERPVGSLYAETSALATAALDDVQVSIRPPAAGSIGGASSPLLSLPISSGDRTWATLEAVAGPQRVLSTDERAFLTSVAAVLSGMASRRQAEENLRRRALYDGLTGLPNRVLILERLGNALAQRDRGPVGVLFVDLDDFKPINDEHGHEVGDALLAALARRVPDVLRAGDTIGRLAGDEFVVVAPDCDEEGLQELAVRLLATLRDSVDVGDVRVTVGASIGGTLADADDHNAREVLRRADTAMYSAKAAGGGIVIFPTDGPAHPRVAQAINSS